MKINFTKMHGIGNDYIYVNCMDGELPDPAGAAIAMSPRHFSVGADGLVMICRSDVADAKMRMFNADGSEGLMCGNAIRCIGKYLYDNGIVSKTDISVETLSGIKYLTLTVDGGKVSSVRVDMGNASFDPKVIPVKTDTEAVMYPITVPSGEYRFTAVSMGNPHAVIYIDDNPAELDLEKIGPSFENHPLFPARVNTEFIQVLSPTHLKMRVWERGSGETWACGTGACATVAASVKNGISPSGEPVTVSLVGGELTIVCTEDYRIFMSGPAAKSYDGVYEYEDKAE
jgi:diaminopimelate epimerase